jgi:transcriptional regulator with XRE-family HTH domain
MMVDEQSLLKDLVDAISTWLEGGRGRSLSGLARRCQVAYSTIRRIAQGESTPHPYTALAISEIIMSTAQRVHFLKKHFPTIGNLMDECYAPDIRQDANEERLRGFLMREPHNRIFNIAATRAGTDRNAVNRLAGRIGEEALDEMLESGVLIEEPNGQIKYTDDNWAYGNVDDTLAQVKQSADHFDKTLVGTDGASLMHATGAISKERIPELKALVLRFIKDVNALKDAPEAEGTVHFFCNLMYSLYDREEWNREKEYPQ